MSKQLEAQLGVLGYDAVTARELVKLADEKPDDVAKEFLEDIIDDPSSIQRYINGRGKSKPLSQSRAATASPGPSRPGTPSNTQSTSKSRPAPKPSSSRDGPVVPGHAVKTEPYAIPLIRGGQVPAQKAKKEPQPNREREATTQIKVESIHDLDAALRKLELADPNRAVCHCMGSLHGLLEVAPNCLNCGKVVCNKEGLGPCLSCGKHLVSEEMLGQVYSILAQQREDIVSSMGKKALKSAGIDPNSIDKEKYLSNIDKAQANRDKLLSFQASGAVRTRIVDQVADFETPDAGTNLWASPAEQARQLRNQQRQLRKQDELRKARTGRGRKVISIDIRGNKVYQDVEDVIEDEEASGDEEEDEETQETDEAPRLYYDSKEFSAKYTKPEYPERPEKKNKKANSAVANLPVNSRVADYDEDMILGF